MLMNSEPWSQSSPSRGKGSSFAISSMASWTQRWALFGRPFGSVQPVATQVRSRVTELPERRSAVVGHEIDLTEPRAGVVPLGEGPDGNLALEDRAGLGPGASFDLQAGPFRSEGSIDSGRGPRKKLVAYLAHHIELPEAFEGLHGIGHERGEALTRGAVQGGPHELQGLDDLLTVGP